MRRSRSRLSWRRSCSARRRAATSAASVSITTIFTHRYAWSISSDSLGVPRENGPRPLSVPSVATVAVTSTAAAAPGSPKRSAPQTRTGSDTNISG